MLQDSPTVAFVATSNPQASKHFYSEILGLKVLEETAFAIILKSVNTVIRVQKTQAVSPPPYTSLGWEVENIDTIVSALSDKGVEFERFDGLAQDNLGLWRTPDGASVAWFKDPDGNVLSLTQKA